MSAFVSTENNASIFKMKNRRNIFQPNTDANTGDNPAYRYVNIISGLSANGKNIAKFLLVSSLSWRIAPGADYCEIS